MPEVKETAVYQLMIRDLPQNERPRERLEHIGAQAVATAELMAIVLRTGSGGENVLRLAERILHRFGDLAGVARASLQELQEVRGVGPAKAAELKAALELGRRLTAQMPEERPRITCPSDAANLLMSEMSLLEQEHLRVLLLNTRNEVLRINTVYIGNVNTSVIRIAEIFRPAIRDNAAYIIVVHNHPSGDPSPSPEDIRVTREIDKSGKLLGIELLDHIVIGHNRFVSLKERRLGFDG